MISDQARTGFRAWKWSSNAVTGSASRREGGSFSPVGDQNPLAHAALAEENSDGSLGRLLQVCNGHTRPQERPELNPCGNETLGWRPSCGCQKHAHEPACNMHGTGRLKAHRRSPC